MNKKLSSEIENFKEYEIQMLKGYSSLNSRIKNLLFNDFTDGYNHTAASWIERGYFRVWDSERMEHKIFNIPIVYRMALEEMVKKFTAQDLKQFPRFAIKDFQKFLKKNGLSLKDND